MSRFFILFLVLLISIQVHAGLNCSEVFKRAAVSQQYQSYLQDTLSSLEAMRGENGLLKDSVEIKTLDKQNFFIENLVENTSPTNIAIDLLIQAELYQMQNLASAKKNLDRTLKTLSKAEFHHQTGLFFSRYTVDKSTSVTDFSVSSVDNLHLALALWTIKENFNGTSIGRIAGELFSRMDFSLYYDKSSGLIGGNLRYDKDHWVREEYNFSNFGSEARILYSLGWALGLFRIDSSDTDFYNKALDSMEIQIRKSNKGLLLKLWDGSAFQLYFPKIFLEEKNYSPLMASIYKATTEYMLSEGRRRRLDFPAAHSATRANLLDQASGEPAYKDKSGNKKLVSENNQDINEAKLNANWDTSFSPYALVMAATDNPEQLTRIFTQLQNYPYREFPLYVEGLGWMDSVFVKGKNKGLVVPAQLSLNQGMLALSLLKITSVDGQTLSSRTVKNNNSVREKIQLFYQLLEDKTKYLILF